MLVSSLAMPAHSADIRKIKPGDLRPAILCEPSERR
jgi:hypothetical protein